MRDPRSVEVLAALRRTRELVARSEDSDWSTRSARKLEKKLDRLIRSDAYVRG